MYTASGMKPFLNNRVLPNPKSAEFYAFLEACLVHHLGDDGNFYRGMLQSQLVGNMFCNFSSKHLARPWD